MAFSLDDLSDVAALNKNRMLWTCRVPTSVGDAAASGYFNAVSGGLVAGEQYRTTTGEMRVVV